MPSRRQLIPVLLGLAVLAGSMQAAIADSSNPAMSAPSSGMARVWFLRPGSPASAVYAAAPVIFANGAAVGAIPDNAAFYRDFTPGSYRFTVQSYGLPNNAADTVQLAAGTQTYLEVQSVPVWEEGYASGGGEDSHSFFVLNMSSQLAQAWIPALTDIGQR